MFFIGRCVKIGRNFVHLILMIPCGSTYQFMDIVHGLVVFLVWLCFYLSIDSTPTELSLLDILAKIEDPLAFVLSGSREKKNLLFWLLVG